MEPKLLCCWIEALYHWGTALALSYLLGISLLHSCSLPCYRTVTQLWLLPRSHQLLKPVTNWVPVSAQDVGITRRHLPYISAFSYEINMSFSPRNPCYSFSLIIFNNLIINYYFYNSNNNINNCKSQLWVASSETWKIKSSQSPNPGRGGNRNFCLGVMIEHFPNQTLHSFGVVCLGGTGRAHGLCQQGDCALYGAVNDVGSLFQDCLHPHEKSFSGPEE